MLPSLIRRGWGVVGYSVILIAVATKYIIP
jgi:hypothetical protein